MRVKKKKGYKWGNGKWGCHFGQGKKTRLAAIWLELFLRIQKKMTEHALLLF